MQQQSVTPKSKAIQPHSPKQQQKSFRNSLHSTSKEGSSIPQQKQSDYYSQDQIEKFGKTYFKSKMNKINELKFTKINKNSNNLSNKKVNKNVNNQEKLNKNLTNLQKIDQRFQKYAILEKSHNKNDSFSKQDNKINKYLLPQSPKVTFLKSPKMKSSYLHGGKRQRKQQCEHDQSGDMSRMTQNQQHIQSISQLLQPISLKKKLNMIRKHKQILQHEFHRRRASLEFKQRNIARQEKKVSAYRSKFQKIINARQQRSLQRNFNQREIQQHDKQIMQQKYYLRSTVLNTQDNLQSSRLSLCLAKMNLANQTRVQKRVNIEQLKQFESHTLSQKKRRCQSVRSSKIRTQQSVQSFNYDKRMTINQRKLQQISHQLVSLQQQKLRYSTFYRQKDQNEVYRSRIKEKKQDLQKKAKLYKINLMLELNRNDRLKIKNQQQNQMIELKNSTTTQLYRKKRHTVSTEPDLNLLTTAKNNSIYKRWGNSILSSSLNEQVGN